MRRIAARKASYLLAALVSIAVLIFAVRSRRYDIVATLLAGTLLTQVILWIVRGRRILAPAGALVPAGLDHVSGSPRRQRVKPAELPPPPGLLIGRDTETEELCARLAQPDPHAGPRVVLISGAPGIGKTALATNVAHLVADAYPDGQLLLRVDDQHGGWVEDGLETFVWSLKGPRDPMPDAVDHLDRYRRLSLKARLLIMLDNVPDPGQIGPLLPAGSQCAVIVTSRRSVPDPGAVTPRAPTEIRLSPLGEQDAGRLLNRLVGGDAVTRQPEYARRIVQAAAGYPVALHMAGAALALRRNWTLELAVGRMVELAAGRPDESPVPFRGILDLCFALLTEQERRAAILLGLVEERRIDPWMLVALFRGGAPEPLAVTEPDAKHLFDRLARVRLLERRYDDSSGLSSFRMPSYVRGYAHACAGASLPDQTQRAALDGVRVERQQRAERNTELHLRETVYQLLDEGELEDALNAARESVAWSRERATTHGGAGPAADEGLTLAALAEVYAELGWIGEGLACARAAQKDASNSDHTRARARRALGTLLRYQHLAGQALPELWAALSLARRDGDRMEQVRVLRELVTAYAITDKPEKGIELVAEARGLCEGEGQTGQRHLPGLYLAQGRALRASAAQGAEPDPLAQASGLLSRAEKLTLSPGSRQQLWRPWIRLEHALVALDAGQPEQSRILGTSALEGFTTLRHRYGVAHARLALGRAYLAEGSVTRAIEALEEGYGTFHRCGDRWIEARCAVVLAEAYLGDGRGQKAVGLLNAAEQAFAVIGDDDSRQDVSYRLWTAESSYPSEPLFRAPREEQPDPAAERRFEPEPPRTVTWPTS
jgi:tetratricopeptide (TPR) repeat protein